MDIGGNHRDFPTSGDHTVSIDLTPDVTCVYDPNGDTTAKTVNGPSPITHTYDFHGQLKQINLPGGKREKFCYDGLGRRIYVWTGTADVDENGNLLSTRFHKYDHEWEIEHLL